MIDLTNIRSLTEFKRNTAASIARLRKTGEPQVLTVNGRAEVVVQDARAYQALLDLVETTDAMRGIQEGMADHRAGRARPATKVMAELRRELGIPPRPRRRPQA